MAASWLTKIRTGFYKYLRNTDWLLLASCLAASVYGIVLVYSSTITSGSGSREYLTQVGAVLVGLAAAVIVSLIDYDLICRAWPVLAGITLLLMALTFTPLGLQAPGAEEKAWLNIPIINVTFQPSELLKITFLITFSMHLVGVRDHINRLSTVLLLGVHGLFPIGLVILQGENGTAIVFGFMFIAMMIMAGLRPVYLLAGLTAVMAAIPIVWPHIPESKQARILCLFPSLMEKYPDAAWQQGKAIDAIGAGQLWGQGFTEGTYFFARNNDFIFSVAGEEFGFAGSCLLLGVLALVVLALMRNVFKARDLRGMLICGGMLAMIGSQTVINLGMNLRLLPVIGITLPFFSRGGSAVATLLLGIGLVLSIHYSSRTRVSDTIFVKKRY